MLVLRCSWRRTQVKHLLDCHSTWASSCAGVKQRMSSSHPVAAVCQVTATPDKEANFAACKRLVQAAKESGASMVFLPEGFDYIGSSREETLDLSEDLTGQTISRYAQLAKKLGVWLSLGGFHERGHDWVMDRRIYNSHIIINEKGDIVTVYRKSHLFDVELPARGVSLKESGFTIPGPSLIPPVHTPIGKVGLGICYDLRFPELSLALVRQGAEILTYPSAFTVATGAAHWCCSGPGLLRPSALSLRQHKWAVIMKSVRRTAMHWLWTPGAW
ncbi:deaminated glutathione amidase isoform X2 [Esox lucius]|uniref:deaminated glutathione amidase isoform X2 n=1 Tax=Esox lucius TaxID=8010 RepID=UPI001476AA5E|nr:deaminated glutathione amidase isoform X2 [Esox lucius]